MSELPLDLQPPDYYRDACEWLGQQYPAIDTAIRNSQDRLDSLSKCVGPLRFADALSFVVFGSLARAEVTSGSDVDWTLLIDGPSDLDHYRMALEISQRLENEDFVKPGQSGAFAGLTSSHDLVHNVGGEVDTNANTTRRLLLLLESRAVAGSETRDRVISLLLGRYIKFGRGVDLPDAEYLKTPRFLLNDFVRYWRTLAVDYASKKWLQDDKKWAIRNSKLRFSRKLLFLKGLLICIDCELSPTEWP